MFSRALAFVILGLSVGALIGLTQVVLKEAWLTVVDGFRPGRQLILSQSVTTLGRGDHLPLPFLGYAGKDLESEHLHIVRQPDGSYQVEDHQSRIGTRVNGQFIQGPVTLRDGDLIRLGSNIVRFNQSGRAAAKHESMPVDLPAAGMGKTAPPPPPPSPPSGTPPQPPASLPPQAAGGLRPFPHPTPHAGPGSGPRIPPPPPPPT